MTETANADDIARLLWDKHLLEKCMLDFGRALDTSDWALYESCFEPEFEVDFERLTGQPPTRTNARLWTRFAEAALSGLKRHHAYSNFDFRITGNEASGTIYMVARHWRPTDRGSAENTQYGWYENSFRKSDGRWRITRLRHYFQWVSGNDALLDVGTPEVAALVHQIFAPAD